MPDKNGGAAKPKVLIWDIETAGVQGLCADRGFVVCFGYKWLGEKEVHCLTLNDYPGKNCHDDSKLLAEAVKVIIEAATMVAHYGAKFDKPFVEARLLKAGLPPIPNTRLADTCLISRVRLKLSSNRLGNLAAFLGVKTQKMEKRDGWPDWWLGALRGDKTSIEKMAVYCKQDVQCLEECYLKMRHIIPTRYLYNASVMEAVWRCPACGGYQKQDKGLYHSEMMVWQRHKCKTCHRWSKSPKHVGKASTH